TLPTAYLAPEEWYRLWCKYCPGTQANSPAPLAGRGLGAGRCPGTQVVHTDLSCASSPAEWEADIGCQIEVMESFPKQTYRNRCTITTPDGPLTLTVPVKHSERKQLTRDVEISYQKHWQHQHWIALVSAYKRTPYFDYYMDYFRPFYEKETKFLLDLNEGLHEVIQTLMENRQPQATNLRSSPAPLRLSRQVGTGRGAGGGEKEDSKSIISITLPHTTDWQAQDLETCFGNGMSILDKLMEYGPETIMKI
ncbi:MAG: WbqC family protein, partial [Paludibacteraceae bacterium]